MCVKVHIEFTDGEERISLEGPTEEVEQAQTQIQEIIKDLVSTYTHTHVHTADLKNMCEQCIKRILSPYVSSQNVRHTWWLQLFRHEGLLLFCVYVLAYLISLCFQPLLRKKQSSWRCNLGPFFNDFLTFYTLNCGANYKGNSLQINQWALTAGLHRVFITVTGWMFISCVESAHAAVKRSVKVKSLGENRSRFQDKFSHKP